MADARRPEEVAPFLSSKVDWIHQDLSIADQAETFLKICLSFLSPGGKSLLSLKAASERSSDGDDKSRFNKAERTLNESDLRLIERIDLRGMEEQHVLFVCEFNPTS
jgi:fibrillarin-like rRNA methylase